MANTFKKIIDRQMWVQTAPTPNAHAAGMGLACDMRNDMSRNPVAYQLTSATILNRYNFVTKSWDFIGSQALGGTVAGADGDDAYYSSENGSANKPKLTVTYVPGGGSGGVFLSDYGVL